jgi:phosphoglycolate phosphatase-like HAD superfamily hydrolase
MSRFDKVPVYLGYAGERADPARVEELCARFGALVQQAVVDAPWVAGAERWLRENPHGQAFALVSATPQGELDEILAALDLAGCFADVFGAPTPKADAVRRSLARCGVAPDAAVFIGDARADCAAAAAASVPFILRRHASNGGVCADWGGPAVRDLTEL